MSKRFKGKRCAYCGKEGASQSGDHVFAREFFLPSRRQDLPQVAACLSCNNDKSKLEHYLTAVLPFGGRHPDATEALSVMVPRRLATNKKLYRELAEGRSEAVLNEGGVLSESLTVPVNADHLRGFFRYAIRGLMAHHWGTYLPPTHYVGVGLLTPEGEQLLRPFLNSSGPNRVRQTLGEGAFVYEGVRGSDDPTLSIWRFAVYGGALFGGETDAAKLASATIWGMTATTPMPELFGD